MKALTHLPLALLLSRRIAGIKRRRTICSPFRELRNHHRERVQLLIDHGID
jgi:hypothetical protein